MLASTDITITKWQSPGMKLLLSVLLNFSIYSSKCAATTDPTAYVHLQQNHHQHHTNQKGLDTYLKDSQKILTGANHDIGVKLWHCD